MFDCIFIIITALYILIILFFLFGLYLRPPKRTDKKYRVSVVIAARNEEKNIGNVLSELAKQTYPDELFEVIVVNDESEDNTEKIIENYASEYQFIKQVQTKSGTSDGLTAKKRALSQGISASTGEIILSTDADCHVKPTWIETMVSYFTDEVGFVVGFSQFGTPRKKYSLFEQLQATDFLSLMAAAQGSVRLNCPLAASGQNLAYRREAFDEVGGYQKIKDRISGDDVLLLQLIHKLTHWKIGFASSASAFNWTYPEKTVKAFLNQRKRWASNGSYQIKLNKTFFGFIAVMFFVNALMLFGIPLYYILNQTLILPLICLLAKFLIEFIILLNSAIFYHRLDLVKYFPIWSVLQIPYVVFTGLLGTFGHFRWKNRTHFQNLTTFRMDN